MTNKITKNYDALNVLVTDKIVELLEQYLAINEQVDMFKYQVKEAMKQNGIKKWETDLFTFNLREGFVSKRVDTSAMKDTNIMIANADTGELEEVNAYEYFAKSSYTNESLTMKIKEDKYGG